MLTLIINDLRKEYTNDGAQFIEVSEGKLYRITASDGQKGLIHFNKDAETITAVEDEENEDSQPLIMTFAEYMKGADLCLEN